MTEQQVLKDATVMSYSEYEIEEYTIDSEPYYLPIRDEVEVFSAAYEEKIPVILKGPTGCGKTRFVGIHGVAAWTPHHHREAGRQGRLSRQGARHHRRP